MSLVISLDLVWPLVFTWFWYSKLLPLSRSPFHVRVDSHAYPFRFRIHGMLFPESLVLAAYLSIPSLQIHQLGLFSSWIVEAILRKGNSFLELSLFLYDILITNDDYQSYLGMTSFFLNF